MTSHEALQLKHNDHIQREYPDKVITGRVVAVGKKWLAVKWDDDPDKVDNIPLDDVGDIEAR